MEKEKTTPLGKSEREEPERFIPDGMGMFQRNVKRIGDCALAFLALIVFSPLFLLCYIAVKQEDGGPAIFRQERIGRFGRPFNIYKFRSMPVCPLCSSSLSGIVWNGLSIMPPDVISPKTS